MTQKEVRFLYKNAVAGVFEEDIHKDFTWEDISPEKIQTFFREAKISLVAVSPQDALRSLNLAIKDGIKNAGVLFFAKELRRHIIQCQATLAAFKGTSRVHMYDRKDIQDDLMTQYKEAMIFLEKHLNIRTEITGADRKDIYEIPLEALREAVANAIVHRDYSMRGTSLMVEVHEDRVVVSNPGGFPAGMTEQKLGVLSVRRNELIADIFARMNKVERMGSGFKRIREHLTAAGLPFPEMESDNFFIITFKRPRSPGRVPDRVPDRVPVKITDNQEKILAAISEKHAVTIQELAALVGISARKIKANIQKLKAAGFLKRIGPDFGGHWEVLAR